MALILPREVDSRSSQLFGAQLSHNLDSLKEGGYIGPRLQGLESKLLYLDEVI